jgi:membrane-bound metal-dependent hydrolase YbcI (DUF457 family)
MFIGHIAVGLASKRAAPKASLGALTAAALLPDLLWPIFLLTGWEEVWIQPGNTAFTPLAFVHYPWSHSLAAVAAWAALFALGYGLQTRYWRGAGLIGLGVLSHWILDAVTHRPDLPLYPGGSVFIGLGLWNSVIGTVAVEGAMFALAVWLYRSAAGSRRRAGTLSFGLFVATLLLVYVGAFAGPPPPSLRALELTALGAWLLPLWAGWLDRHAAVEASGGAG